MVACSMQLPQSKSGRESRGVVAIARRGEGSSDARTMQSRSSTDSNQERPRPDINDELLVRGDEADYASCGAYRGLQVD